MTAEAQFWGDVGATEGIEPDRSPLVGWQQDDTHDDLWLVHPLVSDGAAPVANEPAQFVDLRPLDVVERRLNSLRDAVLAVNWGQDDPSDLIPLPRCVGRYFAEF